MTRAAPLLAVGALLAAASPGAARDPECIDRHHDGGCSDEATLRPARLLVTATELRLALSRTTLAAGPAIVQLANRGEDGHDLALQRRGSPTARRVPEAAAGELSSKALRLAPGRYVLYCTLPGHRAAGMQAHLTVKR